MAGNWLRNCWYMAGWSEEVGEAGLARRIIDQPIFLYRLADGTVAAMLDRFHAARAMGMRSSADITA